MKKMKSAASRRGVAGGISIETLIKFGLVLVFIGIALIAYFVISEKMAKSNQERITANISSRSNQIALQAIKDDIAKKELEKKAREVAAQVKRKEFILEAETVSKELSVTLAKVKPAIDDWMDFMDGKTGAPVTPHDDIVRSIELFISQNPLNLSLEQGKSQLDFVRLVLLTVQDMTGEAEPAATYSETLTNARNWIKKTETDIQTRQGLIRTSLREAEAKGAVVDAEDKMTVNAAIGILKGNIVLKLNKTKTEIAKQLEDQTNKIAKLELTNQLVITQEEYNRRLEIQRRELQAAREKQQLVSEAQSVETRNVLKPFLDIGVLDQDRKPLLKPGPVSLSALTKLIGSFKSQDAVTKIMVAASDGYIKDRYRWPKDTRNTENIRQAQIACDKLDRLGHILVELGMLNP